MRGLTLDEDMRVEDGKRTRASMREVAVYQLHKFERLGASIDQLKELEATWMHTHESNELWIYEGLMRERLAKGDTNVKIFQDIIRDLHEQHKETKRQWELDWEKRLMNEGDTR